VPKGLSLPDLEQRQQVMAVEKAADPLAEDIYSKEKRSAFCSVAGRLALTYTSGC
jgi:hypothetical protein